MVVTLTGSPAHGEDLAQAKRRAESAISQAQSEVASATTALDAAQAKVREAEAKVEYAQHVLAEATQAWEQAQEVEAQKAIELYEAEQALALAQAKVNAGQAKIDAQTEQINAYARSVVQDSSPLMSVAILLSSGSTAELANRVQWVDTVLFTNQVDLDDLREVLTSLTAARAECEEARIAADLARQEAAAQVEASAAVREEALRAEAEMASALSESQAAKNYAAQVLANRQTSLSQARSDLAAINARIAAEQRAEQARQQAAAAQNSSGSSGSQGSGGGANGQLTPAQAQSAAYGMMASYGWQNQTQFQCLVSLWNRESGWRWSAENPSSGAYGIPQSLPASKMASAGADYRTNAVTQISWGLRYIKSRYGTPCGAWSFWQKNHWY
jgi:septal ring factor EnvC (AmiA/AmiB activator)